ncbi:MAG: tetratricopeptide repeat protein [Candidatus Thorarchaeota archaeon]
MNNIENKKLLFKKELLSSRILITKGQLKEANEVLENINKIDTIEIEKDMIIEGSLKLCEISWRQKNLGKAREIINNIKINEIDSEIVKTIYYDNLLAILWIEGKNYEALSYTDSLIVTKNPAYIGMIYSKYGLIYRALGNLEKALEHHYKSLECFEAINNVVKIAGTLNNVALIEIDLAKYSQARKNLERALQIFSEIGNKDHMILTYINLGSVYGNLDDYEKSLKYYEEGLKLIESAQDPVSTALLKGYIGFAYRALGEMNLALKFYNESLTIYKKMNNENFIANQLYYVGEIYSTIGQLQMALDYLFESLEIHKKIGGDVFIIANNLLEIATIYTEQGLYEAALSIMREVIMYGNKNKPYLNYSINKKFGSIHLQMNNETLAYEHHLKAIDFATQAKSMTSIGYSLLELAIDYLTFGKDIKSSNIFEKFPEPPFQSTTLENIKLLVDAITQIQSNELDKAFKNLETIIEKSGIELKYITYAYELLTEIFLLKWKKRPTLDNYQRLKTIISKWEKFSTTRKLMKDLHLINVIKAKFLISELQFAEAQKILEKTLQNIDTIGYVLLKEKIVKELLVLKQYGEVSTDPEESRKFQEIQIDEILNYLENIKIIKLEST